MDYGNEGWMIWGKWDIKIMRININWDYVEHVIKSFCDLRRKCKNNSRKVLQGNYLFSTWCQLIIFCREIAKKKKCHRNCQQMASNREKT